MNLFWADSRTWLAVTLAGFSLCAALPIMIKDNALRQKVCWFVLVPVSLVLILYAYPVGMKVFAGWAMK